MSIQYRAPEAIEDEIEQTRSRIEHRLEVLGHNVSPGNLISRALGTEQHSLPDAFNAAIHVARSNPVAACLTLAGLAGLAIGGTRDSTGSAGTAKMTSSHPDTAKRVGENAAALKERATAVVDTIQETAAHFANQVSDGVSATAETASGAATDASRYARDTAGAVSDTTIKTYAQVEAVTDAVRKQLKAAPTQARAGGDQAIAWIRENPVPAGLIAVAIGAVTASVATARHAKAPRSRLSAGRELYEAAQGQATATPSTPKAKTSRYTPSSTSSERESAERSPYAPKGPARSDEGATAGTSSVSDGFPPKPGIAGSVKPRR